MLEKEATKYAICYPKVGKGEILTSKDLQEAYIAGAEPREERITELEKENAELQIENAQLDNDNLVAQKVFEENAELKKENAELKETNENLRCTFGEDYIQDEKEFWEKTSYLENKLTKAKEIITNLMNLPANVDDETEAYIDTVLKQAENFIK